MSKLTSQRRLAPGYPEPGPGRPANGTWRWLYATEAGVAVHGPRVAFATQDAAQLWLDRNAEVLLGQRIAWVRMFDGEHVVGGSLSLR